MSQTLDSYSESNHDNNTYEVHGSREVGQSWTNTNQATLESAKFYLKRVGSISGNCVAKVFAHAGTYGTSSEPTGSVLATSDNVDVSTISNSSFELVEFTFSGVDKITLASNTKYVLIFDFDGGSDGANCVKAAEDRTTVAHSGNHLYTSDDGSNWSSDSNRDLIFYVIGSTSTGWVSPGTMADDDSIGTVTWSNPGNATASDDSYATAYVHGGDPTVSHYLKATNFGFSIPSGATIDGIEVNVEGRGYNFDGTAYVSDHAVRIVKGGSIGSTDKSAAGTWPETDTTRTYGGASDLWGETWAYSDINSSTFGMAFSAESSTLFDTSYIDHIQVKVYYTDISYTSPFPSFRRP